MNGLFTPSCQLTLGSQQWTNQLLQIELSLYAAPGIDVLRAKLPAAAPFSAALDDAVELTLNSGEHEEKVFTGQVDSIRHVADGVHVTAIDAGGVLARLRPAVTYENATASTLIKNFAADAGVQTGQLESGDELSFYVADPNRTAWEHVGRICRWIGALASVSAANEVQSKVVNTAHPDVALRYGREILALQQMQSASPLKSFTVAGEAGAGSPSSSDARRPTTDFFQGNRPDGPSKTAYWEWQPGLRTTSSAATAGASLQRSYVSSRQAGKLTAYLQPALRPGTVLQIQDAPDALPQGPAWISRVHHVMTGEGAVTTAWFASDGSAGGLDSLLGSALSAVGSLL
jgi:hypothetical protein